MGPGRRKETIYWTTHWTKPGRKRVISLVNHHFEPIWILMIICLCSFTADHTSDSIVALQRGGKGIDRCVRPEFEAIASVTSDEGQENTWHWSGLHQRLQNSTDFRVQWCTGNDRHLSAYTTGQINVVWQANCQFDDETQVSIRTMISFCNWI